MADIVIDLSQPTVEEPPPAPVSARRVWLREAGLALVALMTLLGATAAQPAGKPVFHRLAMIDDAGGRGQLGFSSGLIFRFEKGGLAAHRIDGTQVWWADLGLVLVNEARLTGNRVIASGFKSTLSSQQEVTVVLSTQTGEELWRISGTQVMTMGDYLIEYNRFIPKPSVFRHLDNFQVAWETDVGAVFGFARSETAEGQWVVYVANGSSMTERELATGKVLRSVTLESPGPWEAVMVDRTVLHLLPRRYGIDSPLIVDRATLTTHGVGEAAAWSTTQDCGQVNCTFQQTGEVSIVDKATGRELWQAPYSRGVIPSPAGIVLVTEAGALLADYTTGNQVPLAGWELVGGEDDRFLMLRIVHGQNATEIAMLVPGGVRSLGRLPYLLTGCQVTGDLLICGTTAQKIGVWRIELPRERDHY